MRILNEPGKAVEQGIRLIFRIWRNRRREQDDELLSAYVDRRLEGESGIELPEHFRAEAEGLAETAALLRSVERVRAPRSFALSPEHVRVPGSPLFTERTGWSLALFRAPTIAAAAAAFVLGLLVIGNLAGILEQDSDDAFARSTATEASLAADAPGDVVVDTPGGEPSISSPAATAAPAATSAAAAAPLAPAATVAPAAAPLAPVVTAAPAAAMAAPAAAAPEDFARLESAEALDMAGADSAMLEDGQEALGAESIELNARSESEILPDDDLAPQPDVETALGAAPGQEFPELIETAVAAGDADAGIELPLWQLELAFGLLALALGGAAVAIKRRR